MRNSAKQQVNFPLKKKKKKKVTSKGPPFLSPVLATLQFELYMSVYITQHKFEVYTIGIAINVY